MKKTNEVLTTKKDQAGIVDIAVVVPFYQKKPKIVTKAIASALSQTIASRLVIIVVDDGSPRSARLELDTLSQTVQDRIILLEQPNGGAGNARNKGLDNLPDGIEYIAFLDSDDEWLPDHLKNAMTALAHGFDAYFSDHYASLYKNISNFDRIGTLNLTVHELVDEDRNIYDMKISMIDHIVSDGGGVIGTSNVVYRYTRFPKLRFREEFYNGQDFFFWMDLSDQGANWCFSTQVHCTCGVGINIYSGSGWGTEKSLQRLRNELFVWVSVGKFYQLSHELQIANKKTVNNLKKSVVRDVFHRVIRFKSVSLRLMKEIIKLTPSVLIQFLLLSPSIIIERFSSKNIN